MEPQRNWMRIFWYAFPIAIAAVFLIPNTAPEVIRWAFPCAIWYIAGRRDQQLKDRRHPWFRKPAKPVASIQCYCGETVPVYVDLEIDGEPGEQRVSAKLDASALWLHSFTKHPDAHKED